MSNDFKKIDQSIGWQDTQINRLARGNVGINGMPIETASIAIEGLEVNVRAFELDGFDFAGGSLAVVPNGTWYVGVDLFSGELIALPRLGHRGWIPLVKVTTNENSITNESRIEPKLPTCRIPRFIEKVVAGESVNVVVLGSSLAEGTGTTQWAGMLFSSSADVADYKIPTDITLTNTAVGGAPNHFGFAFSGYSIKNGTKTFSNGGRPYAPLTNGPLPYGRSELLLNADLVVVTCLANGGDYRLENIERCCRNLKKMGCEVILTTDNAQGHPFTDHDDLIDSALYVDGQTVLDAANRYGFEFADTAAYVADATLRYLDQYPTLEIYRDAIHMYAAEPAGRTGTPAGGYEVWARAIRSVIPVDATAEGTVVLNYDFDDGTTQTWSSYGGVGAVVTNDANHLKVAKADAAEGQWGADIPVGNFPDLLSGDTVRVQGTKLENTTTVTLGLQGGGSGWGSNQSQVSTVGDFDVTLTTNRDIPSSQGYLLLFGTLQTAAEGTYFAVDDLVVTITSTAVSDAFETRDQIEKEETPLPPSIIVKDTKTPGDVHVILPANEIWQQGTLVTAENGSSAFASRFYSGTASDENCLNLTGTEKASVAGYGMVGAAMIYYQKSTDDPIEFDLYRNNALISQHSITPTQNREAVYALRTPTQQDAGTDGGTNTQYEIRMTSGTLRLHALLAYVPEIEFISPEEINFIGTWSGPGPGGSPNMIGYYTDTADDYAFAECPLTGRRLWWLLSNKPDSQPVSHRSGRSITESQVQTGANHVRLRGGHIGPGENHYIQLDTTLAGGGDTTDGYGLHIGGAIIVNDR